MSEYTVSQSGPFQGANPTPQRELLTRELFEKLLTSVMGHWHTAHPDFQLLLAHDAALRARVLELELSRDQIATHLNSYVEQLATVTQERDILIEQEKLQAQSVIDLTAQLEACEATIQQLKDGFNLQNFVDVATSPLKECIRTKDDTIIQLEQELRDCKEGFK